MIIKIDEIPNWSKAPKWANWVAMDADGSWLWYENEPTYHSGKWVMGRNRGKCEKCSDLVPLKPKKSIDSFKSLQKRPA